MIVYSCHGAAKHVTGSCHLVSCGATRVLIDCGLFQGDDATEAANAAPFAFDPASVDALLLTHAHLDHCGRIPKLVREGFRGRIHATAATRELARVVLLDAANLQEEEARRSANGGRHEGEPVAPLYSVADVQLALDCFAEDVAYDVEFEVAAGVRARFVDAGHILGSASIVLDLEDGARHRRMVFSGDLGGPGRPILRDPAPAPAADCVVMESTYGDRPHRSLEASVEELYEAVRTTVERRGNVIVPTFALERAQEILYCLRRGIRDGAIPGHVRVFLDSPMAISATEIFRRHPECFGERLRAELAEGDPFATPGIHFTRDAASSMAINAIESGAVILAGSGMCNGGRVRHHLKHNLWRQRSSVVFVGYAARGSLARQLIDGAQTVRIFGEDVAVRARLWTINGFSAHAGQPELLDWLGSAPRRQVFLVHGEYGRGMSALADVLERRGQPCRMPGMDEPILID